MTKALSHEIIYIESPLNQINIMMRDMRKQIHGSDHSTLADTSLLCNSIEIQLF